VRRARNKAKLALLLPFAIKRHAVENINSQPILSSCNRKSLCTATCIPYNIYTTGAFIKGKPFRILLLEPLRVYYIGVKTPHRIRIAAALLPPELPWHFAFKQTIEHVCVCSLLYTGTRGNSELKWL
jgi:hypothetical protein